MSTDTTTTPVVGRVPIPAQVAADLRADLEEMCKRWAAKLGDAKAAGEPPRDRRDELLLELVTVAEAMAEQTQAIQQRLWDVAAQRGISQSRIAKARGVTQQAIAKRAQRK